MTWRASSQAKYDCKYHLIWCPKRRWGLADAEVRTAVAEVFRAIAEGFGFLIEELPVEDHVHRSNSPALCDRARGRNSQEPLREPSLPALPGAASPLLVGGTRSARWGIA